MLHSLPQEDLCNITNTTFMGLCNITAGVMRANSCPYARVILHTISIYYNTYFQLLYELYFLYLYVIFMGNILYYILYQLIPSSVILHIYPPCNITSWTNKKTDQFLDPFLYEFRNLFLYLGINPNALQMGQH